MTGTRIRRLTERDIPFAMALKNIAGWNQTEEDWRGYLAFDPEGCYLAEFGREPAGTMTTIRYGDRFGWIGMVLVHPDYRGRGIATELLQLGIRYLQESGVRCIKLDATAMGKKVYVPLGFVEEYDVRRYELSCSPPASGLKVGAISDSASESVYKSGSGYKVEVRPLSGDLLDEIAAYDEIVFGASRRAVLDRLSSRDAHYSLYTRDERGITGYMMAHQGYEAVQIGPWAASDAHTAEMLLTALLSQIGHGKVFFDLPVPNAEGIELAEKHGFRIQRAFCRMYLGENECAGWPARIYGTSGAEKG
ncbi:GNAT family N-acetyltransferase [Cohnella sp. JJ-181]|uniref:GNAT family N-acetyltransferase n=1 Tax=Cohnella rhizoplanae TaxID=2974897 RepID=UPI0022FF6DA6|nr:GNAT family N-acetyltransferase [Cohnella sp. JJ-181]CAI6051858.1 hypothetical protein COHCIP112018_01509 [Cohnella sp. JJ-181]